MNDCDLTFYMHIKTGCIKSLSFWREIFDPTTLKNLLEHKALKHVCIELGSKRWIHKETV